MENKIYKSTKEAFILAKNEINAIKNDTAAFGFKYADLVAVQKEVNRVIKEKGLQIGSVKHIENSNLFDQKAMNGKGGYVSQGIITMEIISIWDNEKIEFSNGATFANKTAHDATYSANSIGYRYLLLRAFGIPTLDENKFREEEIKLNSKKENDLVNKTNQQNLEELSLKQEMKSLLTEAKILRDLNPKIEDLWKTFMNENGNKKENITIEMLKGWLATAKLEDSKVGI